MAETGLNGPVAYAQRIVGGWGRSHHAAMREAFERVLTIGSIGESLPSSGTFIDLDPSEVDGNGMPLARIHSRLDETELQRLIFMRKTAHALLKEAGVVRSPRNTGATISSIALMSLAPVAWALILRNQWRMA